MQENDTKSARKEMEMEIGLLALVIGTVFCGVGFAGIGIVQPPEPEKKAVRYPYPKEL